MVAGGTRSLGAGLEIYQALLSVCLLPVPLRHAGEESAPHALETMKLPASMPGLLGWTVSSQTTSPKNFSPLTCFLSGIWSK